MNGLQDLVLVDEIALQTKIAIRAAERLCADHAELDRIDTWSAIQSFLVASGNVSKILWPGKKNKVRGERLRKFLEIKEDNPISNRKFRNHFEHYDERIEEWFALSPRSTYTDLSMNPSFRSNFSDLPTLNTHRGYNSFNNSLVFRDETLFLDELLDALEDIRKRCCVLSLV